MVELHVLFEGYVREGDELRVGSTVGFVRDGDAAVIIDPGLVPNPASILDPLGVLGVEAGAITDIVFSHHHPDHTVNAALFPEARIHDVMAIYQGDLWIDRPAEGFEIREEHFMVADLDSAEHAGSLSGDVRWHPAFD